MSERKSETGPNHTTSTEFVGREKSDKAQTQGGSEQHTADARYAVEQGRLEAQGAAAAKN